MQRKAMSKIVRFAKNAGLAEPGNREQLEEALSGCRNNVTRDRLRAKILRRP